MRAIRILGLCLVYVVAGSPAAIGVTFVARYGLVTSDTPQDGAATAFLFGMVAVGAFAGPAVAMAVGNRGHKRASKVWWALAVACIVANWTHTLSAIAHRSAGLDAKGEKIAQDTAADRKTLARLERELGAMKFSPTSADGVAAAKTAAEIAERNRKTECGANNETRGRLCRERELEEQAKRDALATAVANKDATDRAGKLAVDAAELRKRLADGAPPPPPSNVIGSVFGRFLQMPAANLASIQQGFVSAVVEMLIAAVLALPELFRSSRSTSRDEPGPADRADEAAVQPVETQSPVASPIAKAPPSRRVNTRRDTAAPRAIEKHATPAATEIDPKPVVAFLAEHMPTARGSRADWGDIYSGFLVWQAGHGGYSLEASEFGAVLRHICEEAGIAVSRQGDRVYCLDRRVK
jgi:hypothetical protein